MNRLPALGAGLLVGTWLALRSEAVQRADVRAGDVLRRMGTPALDRMVTGTTDLGSVYGVVGTAVALRLCGRREQAGDTLAVGMAAWVLAQTNKRFVRRRRPYEVQGVRRLIRPPTGSSFPSGHATVGMAVLATAAGRADGQAARALLHAGGAYVAASRVYLGVHYPTDVIGGAGLGLLLAGLWRGVPVRRLAALAVRSLTPSTERSRAVEDRPETARYRTVTAVASM